VETEISVRPRIGLFGGTFNPVHIGHLRCVEEIREQFRLDRIVFVPAFMPPHKKQPGVSPEHRCEMARMAISGNSCFELSDIELQREGRSYSADTIDYFRMREPGGDLFFIIGSDAFCEVHTWHRYPDFFEHCSFIVMNRAGVSALSSRHLPCTAAHMFTRLDGDTYVHCSGTRICFGRVSALDISSTDIRARIAADRTISYLVTAAVERYIRNNRLYRPPS
jgi:nicotinate-nucleotide adenylyltransferase